MFQVKKTNGERRPWVTRSVGQQREQGARRAGGLKAPGQVCGQLRSWCHGQRIQWNPRNRTGGLVFFFRNVCHPAKTVVPDFNDFLPHLDVGGTPPRPSGPFILAVLPSSGDGSRDWGRLVKREATCVPGLMAIA
jgi:hypothetical protein